MVCHVTTTWTPSHNRSHFLSLGECPTTRVWDTVAAMCKCCGHQGCTGVVSPYNNSQPAASCCCSCIWHVLAQQHAAGQCHGAMWGLQCNVHNTQPPLLQCSCPTPGNLAAGSPPSMLTPCVAVPGITAMGYGYHLAASAVVSPQCSQASAGFLAWGVPPPPLGPLLHKHRPPMYAVAAHWHCLLEA